MQLLEQLNLADSLANYSRPTQRPTQHNFSSYTEPEKEQSFLSDVIQQTQDGHSITAAKSLSYLK